MFDFQSDRDDRRFAPPGSVPPPDDLDKTMLTSAGETQPRLAPVPNTETAAPVPVIPPPPKTPPLPTRITMREPVEARREPPTAKRADWAWLIITAALIGVLAVIGLIVVVMFGFNRTNATPLPDLVAALPTPVDARVQYGDEARSAGGMSEPVVNTVIDITPWDGTSRLNILFMGIDRRPGETGIAYRTDTLIIISLNPNTERVGVLSIPRDLYVSIPGYSARQRINSALPLGELQRAGYGPTLAMQTIQHNFGMRIHDYIVADYSALITLIDAMGGIEIDVPTPIMDYWFPDDYYGYDPLILSAGIQWMDGNTAQKYARTRHGDSDFGRARRQQQVIFAMRNRLLNLDNLPALIARAPSIYRSMSSSIETSLSIDQVLRLGIWLKDLNTDAITTGVIDSDYTADFTTEDGASVLIPRTDWMYGLFARVFGADFSG